MDIVELGEKVRNTINIPSNEEKLCWVVLVQLLMMTKLLHFITDNFDLTSGAKSIFFKDQQQNKVPD